MRRGLPQAFVIRAAGYGTERRNFGLTDSPYTSGIIPNVRIESQSLPLHLLTGAYRGPSYNSYAFFLESFIDECSVAAGIDPLEYRLKLLAKWPDAGWIKVLREVAAKAEWGKVLPRGQGQGIAVSNWGTYGTPQPHVGTTVAAVAHVEVSQGGELKVHQIDVAFDCGRILNRDGVLAQIESAVIYALNMTLNERVTIRDGRVAEGNFDEYPMLRIGDMPAIRTHFGGLSGHDRFGRIGEPPVGPIGPAIGNAIFRATGKRLRSTPFREADLGWS
jgi:isoquinoline 1-oxidoreductase beta subunit